MIDELLVVEILPEAKVVAAYYVDKSVGKEFRIPSKNNVFCKDVQKLKFFCIV